LLKKTELVQRFSALSHATITSLGCSYAFYKVIFNVLLCSVVAVKAWSICQCVLSGF